MANTNKSCQANFFPRKENRADSAGVPSLQSKTSPHEVALLCCSVCDWRGIAFVCLYCSIFFALCKFVWLCVLPLTQQCGRSSGEAWPAETYFICKEQPEQWRRSLPANGETVPPHWPQVWKTHTCMNVCQDPMNILNLYICVCVCAPQKPSSEWDNVEKITAGPAWHAAECLHPSKTRDMPPGIAPQQKNKQ